VVCRLRYATNTSAAENNAGKSSLAIGFRLVPWRRDEWQRVNKNNTSTYLLVIFSSRLHPYVIILNGNINNNGLTTDLAIFYVLLARHRTIDQHTDHLTAVGAANGLFIDNIHD